jgi:hypothetical protein
MLNLIKNLYNVVISTKNEEKSIFIRTDFSSSYLRFEMTNKALVLKSKND